jgi:hypothetical protein
VLCYSWAMQRIVWVAVFLSLVACERERRLDDGVATARSPQPTQPQVQPAPKPDDEISGRILETMDSGGYTYAKLARGERELWVAGPQTQLAVGAQLGRMDGMLMEKFHSNTLDRTFDWIYFINAWSGQATPAPTTPVAPPDHKTAPKQDPHASTNLAGTVVETMNAGPYTYAQLEQNGKKFWVAGPQSQVAVGQKLAKLTGSLMVNFRSKTLNRTFDEIYFIDSFGN